MCNRRPANKPTSMMRITMVVAIKWEARLNICPPSFAHIQALIPTCTTRNDIRKMPVRDMINFLPIDEVKKTDHFIYVVKIENQGNRAKVRQEIGNPYLSRSKTVWMKREEDFEANLSGEEGTTEETKSRWIKRIKKGILTRTAEKKETPEGLWTKCPSCNYICTVTELRENLFVCPKCN